MPTTCYCFVILYPTYYLLFDCLLFTIEETINYQLSIPPLPFSDRFPSVLRQSVRLSFPIWAESHAVCASSTLLAGITPSSKPSVAYLRFSLAFSRFFSAMVSFLAASFTWKADWLTCSSIFSLASSNWYLGDACFRFGCFYFIDAFAPVPDGYRHHDTHIPHPLELFLETVEDGRVGCHIAAH